MTHINDYTSGDSRRFDVTIKDETGAPLDITGAAIKWAIGVLSKKTRTILLTKEIGSGIAVVNAAAGQIQIVIGANEFLKVGTFWHELEVELPSGASYTVAAGQFVSKAALLIVEPPPPP